MEEDPVQMRGEREEEEVAVMDLKTRKRSHSLSKVVKASSPTNNDSSITSESSESTSFEYFLSLKNGDNGENHNVTDGVGSINEVVEAEVQNEENSEEPIKKEEAVEEEVITVDSIAVSFNSNDNQGINGISVHENDYSATHSHSEDGDGNQEIKNTSRSSDSALGLKDFESLLDESSKNLNVAATNTYNALEDTLNNALNDVETENVNLDLPKDPLPLVQEADVEKVIEKQVFTLDNASKKSVENENVQIGVSKGPLLEVEEFDVERVIQKQETHDLYCPNCNSCITKRVILKRRKRKIQDISPIEDGRRPSPVQQDPPQSSDGILEESPDVVPPIDDNLADESISAITCLSCFSIFLHTENGWLRRIFRKKPVVVVQPGDSLTEPLEPTHEGSGGGEELIDTNVDDGNLFPLWIVNCCQPSEKRPVRPGTPVAPAPAPQPEPVPEPWSPEIPPEVAPAPEPESGHPESPPEDNADVGQPKPDTKPSVTQPDGSDFALDGTVHTPGADDALSPPKPEPPEKSGKNTLQVILPVTSEERAPDVSGGEKPSPPKTKHDSDDLFSLWCLNCFQPHKDGIHRPLVTEETDKPVPAKPEPLPVDNLSPTSKPEPPTTSDEDRPLAHKPEPPAMPSADNALPPTESKPISQNFFPLWFVNCCQPQTDRPHISGSQGGGAPVASEPDYSTLVDKEKPLQSEPEPPATFNGGTVSPATAKPDTKYDDETAARPKPTPPVKHDDDMLSPPNSIHAPKPDEISSHQDSKPSATPGGQIHLQIPDQGGQTTPPMTIASGTQTDRGSTSDIEAPLLDAPQGYPTPRVSTGVDIIKAVVYGGLVECITSLSVISSAAGGDATTLNIVALGLANVFGGLVLLVHNLRVLKQEHGTARYIEQLGEPGHYLLHAAVAIISYLVFGLMAPIIYGFSFRKSDNKDYKLITLAASSLACIAVLSTAKAHVRTSRNYLKTVLYYLSIGVMVSGVGYAAGHLINELLKKLGVFDSTSPASDQAGDMKFAWASY